MYKWTPPSIIPKNETTEANSILSVLKLIEVHNAVLILILFKIEVHSVIFFCLFFLKGMHTLLCQKLNQKEALKSRFPINIL